MNPPLNVLIVEDHKIIIKTYLEVLKKISKDNNHVLFSSTEIANCDVAIEYIKRTSSRDSPNLIFLDISLPSTSRSSIVSGEGIGVLIREKFPNAKIIICTSLSDNLRLNNIIKSINPEGFLIKSDIDFNDIVNTVQKVIINNEPDYSKTVLNLLRNKASNPIVLDEIDIRILVEISNGSNMKELSEIIPLSRAGIEKRKRLLKSSFKIKNNSDRDLVIKARKKGFI